MDPSHGLTWPQYKGQFIAEVNLQNWGIKRDFLQVEVLLESPTATQDHMRLHHIESKAKIFEIVRRKESCCQPRVRSDKHWCAHAWCNLMRFVLRFVWQWWRNRIGTTTAPFHRGWISPQNSIMDWTHASWPQKVLFILQCQTPGPSCSNALVS